jgi:hypothetical protein
MWIMVLMRYKHAKSIPQSLSRTDHSIGLLNSGLERTGQVTVACFFPSHPYSLQPTVVQLLHFHCFFMLHSIVF